MVRLTILDRFRPVGTPGAAGPTGVPTADEQGPAAELIPVFAALEADVAACTALVADARVSAERDTVRARTQAAAIVAQARREAGAERAKAATRVEKEASERDAQLLEQARREAAALGESGLALLPATVGQIIDRLLAPPNAEQQ